MKILKVLVIPLLIVATPIMVFANNMEELNETIANEYTLTDNSFTSDFGEEEYIKEDRGVNNRIALFAAPAGGPHFGDWVNKPGTTINIYKNATDTYGYTYIEPTASSSGVVPILDQTSSMYKIAISGVVGWVNKSTLTLTAWKDAKGNDFYKVVNGDLFHYISKGTGTTSYSSINQGKAPSYIKSGKTYISYDGNYFYDDTEAGLKKLIADYNAGKRTQSINPNDPYYNYFQYLPARSQTKLTAKDFDNYLLQDAPHFKDAINTSLADTSKLFVDNGNIFGSNSALAYASAVHESGWGKSYFAKGRNNFFGHNAYDSAPGMASTYNSPNTGIKTHFGRFLNWNYIDPDPYNSIYHGGFVGNKAMGMNVKYASDPYWGEKIAAHYYNMDKLAGGKDYGLYTIAITKKANEPIYKTAGGATSYSLKHAGITIAVTGEQKSGSKTYLQHSSEALLTKSKDREPYNVSKIYYPYTIKDSQLYVDKANVDIIYKGKEAKLYTQTNPTQIKEPVFSNQESTVYTIQTTKLYRDWSTKNPSVLDIPKDTKLTGILTDNGFLHLQYAHSSGYTYIGYVSTSHISLKKGGAPIGNTVVEDPKPTLPSKGNIKYIITADPNLTIRTGPGTNYSVVGYIPLNAKAIGGKPLGGWVNIEYSGMQGYSSYEYLKEDTGSEAPKPTWKVADINNDGKLDIIDAALMQSHLRKINALKGDQLKAADINGDGKVDVIDAALIQSHLRNIKKIKGW